jgi:para-aminobenzoate synthetase component 1
MTIEQFESQANYFGQRQLPFLFVIDFEMEQPLLFALDGIDPAEVCYSVNGVSNTDVKFADTIPRLVTIPSAPETYAAKFQNVIANLENGNSFLTNLTIRTEVVPDCTLEDIYYFSRARYKLLLHDSFLVFSPEIFVRTDHGKISSFPMKGTIDASLENAAHLILSDPKEFAEHVTIVDLIRNDLSIVADNVTVERFRYIDHLLTSKKQLLQVSSEITGHLRDEYVDKPGSLLRQLLPAGSVSGAPKNRTVQIIRETEKEKRGYYTGVFGIFDGRNIDSGVMIRFIEKSKDKYYYRSGGGITTQSKCEEEYKEVLNKIYVPVD